MESETCATGRRAKRLKKSLQFHVFYRKSLERIVGTKMGNRGRGGGEAGGRRTPGGGLFGGEKTLDRELKENYVLQKNKLINWVGKAFHRALAVFLCVGRLLPSCGTKNRQSGEKGVLIRAKMSINYRKRQLGGGTLCLLSLVPGSSLIKTGAKTIKTRTS